MIKQLTNIFDFENYELLSSSDKDISALSPAILKKVSKKEKYTAFISTTLTSNWSRSKQVIPPLLVANLVWGPQYEISNTIENRLDNFIANKISEIPEVEYIFCLKKENYIEIWTIINKLDREVRKGIYNIEFDILEKIKGLYFYFHVVCRNDRNPEDLFSAQSKLIFQRYE